VRPTKSVKSALNSCPGIDFPLKPGIKKKYAAAQEIIAAKVNTTKGMDSFGSSPLRMISGRDQIMRRIKKGNMENGATKAPERELKTGNEVNGRHIKAIAQRSSQTRSKLNPNLFDALTVTGPS
jgi:hypothetical protein